MNGGVNNQVSALILGPQQTLIVGGTFSSNANTGARLGLFLSTGTWVIPTVSLTGPTTLENVRAITTLSTDKFIVYQSSSANNSLLTLDYTSSSSITLNRIAFTTATTTIPQYTIASAGTLASMQVTQDGTTTYLFVGGDFTG